MSVDDHGLAYLLDLNGEDIVYENGAIARFRVKAINATPEKPHGISYSLTFHAPDGRRLMGYDNAHGVVEYGSKFAKRPIAYDHWHSNEKDEGRPYRFESAEMLIADFFDGIERILKERDNG